MSLLFSSRRRHTSSLRDWSSDVCSSDLGCVSSRYQTSALSTRSGAPFARSSSTVAPARWWTTRSEERRVGKECRSRRLPHRYVKRREGAVRRVDGGGGSIREFGAGASDG